MRSMTQASKAALGPLAAAALQPLIGNWKVLATFHGKDGRLSYDAGAYRIRAVLGGTYIEIDATLHDKEHPERQHSFMELITSIRSR